MGYDVFCVHAFEVGALFLPVVCSVGRFMLTAMYCGLSMPRGEARKDESMVCGACSAFHDKCLACQCFAFGLTSFCSEQYPSPKASRRAKAESSMLFTERGILLDAKDDCGFVLQTLRDNNLSSKGCKP